MINTLLSLVIRTSYTSSALGGKITVFNNNILPNKLFLTSGGAFILLGILMAIINHFKGVNNNV